VHQASRLVNDLLMAPACHAYLPPGGAPASFKRRLGRPTNSSAVASQLCPEFAGEFWGHVDLVDA
jgi:hypothetical protein